MTKKVLISWGDYKMLQVQAAGYTNPFVRLMKFMDLFAEWFDAQPDFFEADGALDKVQARLNDASESIDHALSALSKMETTGGENEG